MLQGAIFDVDGVLLDSPHFQAWRDSLSELMRGPWAGIVRQSRYAPERFTEDMYERVIAGKPRPAGALAALEYFAVPDADRRAARYAVVKQEHITSLIAAGKFGIFPDGIRFIIAVKEAGFAVAAASSSENADQLMQRVSLDAFARGSSVVRPGLTLFCLLDKDVSGRVFPRGKPDPMIYLAAAQELGIAPAECFVTEDAPSGVLAAKRGGMAAIGVARVRDGSNLLKAGADLVVPTLDDVSVSALAEGRLERRSRSAETIEP
jgi:beta-phosphoglucomutase-like phosphatase (HAD superfamily)